MSNSLQPHGLQHARLPHPPLSPRVCSDSFPLSQWYYLTISSSVPFFSLCLNLSQYQSLFQWVISLHQVAKVLELQPQHQSFQWRENKHRHELHEETLNLGVGVLSNMDTVKNRDEYQLHCHKELSDWIAATGSTQPVNLLIVERINCRNV